MEVRTRTTLRVNWRSLLLSEADPTNYYTVSELKESIAKWSRPYKLHCKWIEGVYYAVKRTLQTTLWVNWRSLLQSEVDPTNYTASELKESIAKWSGPYKLHCEWKGVYCKGKILMLLISHSSDSTLLFNDNQEFQGQSIAYVGFKLTLWK
jgi:hypothetical protein